MLAKTYSAAQIGYDAQLIEVECDISNGLPSLVIVGLANKAIDEAKERLRGAIKNSNLKTPQKRITLNLAPADLPKDGTAYDLAMALAILAASGQVKSEELSNSIFIGEVALDGKLRPVFGILSYAQLAKNKGFKKIFVPKENAMEACLIYGIDVIPVSSLSDIYKHLINEKTIPLQPHTRPSFETLESEYNLKDIYGQEQAKRALEIAAAGHHNLLLNGPPGAGKTMLAKSITSILPVPSLEEIIEITKLHSLAGINKQTIIGTRPFRSPHHTASDISLIGGGQNPRPGEISLSNHGVLFLDEIPEFHKRVLEVLRQPLEDKCVTISRASRSVTYPAHFMLIATQNPCPCGYAGDEKKECTCSSAQIVSYQKKISGPLLDRIDIVSHVKRVENNKLLEHKAGESSLAIAKRIHNAREIQKKRFSSHAKTNSDMKNIDIKKHCLLDPSAKSLLSKAVNTMDLTARSYMRVLKVARTIADLEASININTNHLSEALQYRNRPFASI